MFLKCKHLKVISGFVSMLCFSSHIISCGGTLVDNGKNEERQSVIKQQPVIEVTRPEICYLKDDRKSKHNKLIYYFDGNFIKQMEKDQQPYMGYLSATLKSSAEQAAEIWNEESRAKIIQYGGTITNTKFESECIKDGVYRVLLRYNQRCDYEKGNCKPTVASHGYNYEKCPHRASITIHGKSTIRGKDTSQIHVVPVRYVTTIDEFKPIKYRVKENGEYVSIESHTILLWSVILHEFGHALGLDHTENSLDFRNSSVMTASPSERERNHLWEIDKTCSAKTSNGARRENPVYQAVNSLGVPYPKRNFSFLQLTEVGPRIGVTSNIPYAPQTLSFMIQLENYTQNYMRGLTRPEKNDTSVYWREQRLQDSSKLPRLEMPATFSKISNKSSIWSAFIYNQSHKLTEDPLYGTTDTTIDPPELNVSYLDNTNDYKGKAFIPNTVPTTKQHLERLTGKIVGSDGKEKVINLHSHIPVSVTYDPLSKRYVYVSVDTNRPEGSGPPWPDSEGGIRISTVDANSDKPWETGRLNYLHKENNQKDNLRDRVRKYHFWEYRFKTNFGVAVTCIPHLSGKYTKHNCLLAWVDRGMPMETNVLYTWFGVEGENISWSGKVYTRSRFHAVGNLSAGFVGGALVLTAKKDNQSAHMTVNPLNKATGFHPSTTTIGDGDVVTPPTVAANAIIQDEGAVVKSHSIDGGVLLWTRFSH